MPPKVRKVVSLCETCGDTEYARGLCHAHYMQDYAARNAETLKVQRAYWRETNRAELLGRKREYRVRNAELLASKQRAYAKENPDVVKANAAKSNRTRRARIAGVVSESYSADDVLTVYGTSCYICLNEIDLSAPRSTRYTGWRLGLHLDHVIPIVAEGGNTLANVHPSHGGCNVAKGSKTWLGPVWSGYLR